MTARAHATPLRIVITGGGSGIGRAVALACIDAGHRVALMGRRLAAIEETLALRPSPERHLALKLDVTREDDVEDGFSSVVERFGGVDVLFNNAGSFAGGAAFEDVALADWRAAVDVNLTGAFLCARAAFRRMKAGGGGRIINNGSISAQVPRPHAAAYTATKHAITGLTKTISLEGRAFNIACGQIDIGNAQTSLTTGFGAGTLQADGSVRQEPTMDVSGVADAVLFMAALPLDANVQFMTVMATAMPFIGRG